MSMSSIQVQVSDNVDGCCAMFNNCSSVLESTYKEHFYSKLKLGYPSTSDLTQAIRSRFQNPEQIQKQKIYFLVTLNNVDQSIEFISTVQKTFEEYTSKLFDQESQSSREKLTSCLNDLATVGSRFKTLLDYGFDQLTSNELEPKIKQWCGVYSSINHKITEEEYNLNETDDPFVQNFVKNLDLLISGFKDSLSEKNRETLTSLIASKTAILFEKNIFKCSFSKYGGLQLDKEIRQLINYLTSQTTWSTREKFSRLTQISILLGLENLMELFEYWNSPLAITWRLTPNEIRQVLLLREDFKAEEVRNLKL
ncbi:conserved oligomeric Golgi complex subunit 4 [Brachionus plicatilis]|uniref:Conserved oligomeric Golgi complex subunit 4 n=1 Tax=Brachionus plicatilis TaxID=10195 RepID=A0A3M7QIE0_BRAPC|nr:conserved oligomeric Golgi complex subunit 4 [Brachionus plicatilis]